MIKDAMNKNENVSVNGREIEALKEYFPACFHDGEFDLDRFKEYLGDQLVVRNDGYELRFLGKNYGRLLASMDTTTVVVPDEEHNSRPENKNSQNIYISGDNLDGLKHLLKSYAQSVQCIYIDPPYNTGSDEFVYNDNFNFTVEDLQEKLSIDEMQAKRILDLARRGSASHSAWLLFMYPRLLLARDLLSDDGVIFISIDDNEQANLKLLCDDVFGEENFINCITIKAKSSAGASGGGEDKRLKKNCESALFYARKKDQCNFNAPIRKTDLMDYISQHKKDDIGFYYTKVLLDEGTKHEVAKLNPGEEGEIKVYEHDNYQLCNVSDIAKKEKLSLEQVYLKYFDKIYMVTNPQTSIVPAVNKVIGKKQKLVSYEYFPISGKNKGVSTIKYIWNETLVVWLKDSAYIENGKVIKTEQIGTLWDNISWGRLDLEGDMPYKNGKKPTALIRQLINMILPKNNNEQLTVLDFFAGSASTAHACMLENTERGKENYRYIMIQIAEDMDYAYKTASAEKRKNFDKLFEILDASARKHSIDQIGIERIIRATKKIKEENPDTTVDLGFKHYTLKEPSADTLDKLEQFNPDKLYVEGDLLQEFGSPTVLTTWLVHDGYGLTEQSEPVSFAGYTGYWKDKHLYLIEKGLTNEIIAAIIDKYETDGSFNPENVILFGYSFTWSVMEGLKTNLMRLKDTEKNLRINFEVRF